MKKIILFLLLCLSIEATAALDIEMFLGPGYRRDEFKVRVSQNGSSIPLLRESFKVAHSAQEVFNVNLIWGRVRWENQGDFGWLVEAEGKASSVLNGVNPLKFRVKNFYGYEADGRTQLGYDIPLYCWRNCTLELSPYFGFQYRHLASRVKGTVVDEIPGVTGFASFEETRLNHADLWGPFFEARFGLDCIDFASIKIFYQYHYFFYRHVIEPTIRAVTRAPLTYQLNTMHLSLKDNGAGSHLGGFDVNINVLHGVILGFRGFGARTFTNCAKSKNKMKVLNMPAETFAISEGYSSARFRWTIYSVALYFGYRF